MWDWLPSVEMTQARFRALTQTFQTVMFEQSLPVEMTQARFRALTQFLHDLCLLSVFCRNDTSPLQGIDTSACGCQHRHSGHVEMTQARFRAVVQSTEQITANDRLLNKKRDDSPDLGSRPFVRFY